MSDNDSIKRGDAKAALGQLTLYRAQIEYNSVFVVRYTEAYDALNGITAIPREMTAREFARDRNRMCLFHLPFCNGCPVLPERMECGEVIHDCPLWTLRDPDKAIAIVEKWAQEHPERSKE